LTVEIAIVLLVVGAAFVLFWTERLAVEIVGLMAVLVLTLSGILTPEQAFSGFGEPALVMIASILVLSASLVRNGAAERIVERIERVSAGGPERMAFGLFIAVLFVSAFINNVAATAMFIPVAESLARSYQIPPRRLLMPVAYASLLGGVCTLTGTSTNVAVSGALYSHGLPEIGIFELTPVGLPIALIGVVYLVVFSRWLPGRAGEAETATVDEDPTGPFMTELEVPDGSIAIGRTLRELELEDRYRLTPMGLIRGNVRLSEAVLDTPLRAGDDVLVEGDARAINRGAQAAGLERKRTSKKIFTSASAPALVEATISYNSPLVGRTLREVDLRGRYGLDVIAIWRRGGSIVEKIGDIRLRLGDDLLIQGPLDRIRQVARDPLYLLLDDRVMPRYEKRNELLSLLFFALAILLGLTRVVPIPIAFCGGAVLLLLTRCLTLEEAYRSLNLKLLLLIGSMFGVATALEVTGAATWLAKSMIEVLGGNGASPLWIVAGLYWLTVLLTQSMSNAAAALLVLPVALSTADLMQVDSRPFAITVAVAASLAFMTPLEPACLLVMSTGRYRFRNFLQFGAPLTVACFAMVLWLVPLWFPWN
jgi:di/tricarboxylate transporter